MTRLRATTAATLALLALACSPSKPEGEGALAQLPSPAGPGSGEPFLSAGAEGRVNMTWLEKKDDSTYALRFSQLAGDTWGPVHTIVERGDFFVNWADFPSVVSSSSGRLVAHWLQRSGAGKYSYDVRFSQSLDSGATWSPGTVLHRDGVPAEHGFVALWPSDGDAVEAAWLDGRGTVNVPAEARAMHVATTRIAADGSLGEEVQLDQRTCDCCQVAAAMTARGPVVAYRDRTTDEIRDIAVVRRVEGAWTQPAIVHDDGWQIAACPVNGPAVAARGDTVVIAWFTGAQDTARVRAAFSTDAGATFGPPQRIDGGTPAGRVDIELLDDGSAAVSWLERTDGTSAEVRLRRVRPDGQRGDAVVLARSSGARASGFPRLARSGDRLIAAWTMPGDSARIHVARFALKALP
ncbi:MAG: sialidase family protein [Gemmatimonadaceae bacterium]